MTKPTPQQMLGLANIVEPDKEWCIKDGKIYLTIAPKERHLALLRQISRFDPLENDGQLMQVAFALWSVHTAYGLDVFEYHKSGEPPWKAKMILVGCDPALGFGDTKAEAIVNLAIEVLCK